MRTCDFLNGFSETKEGGYEIEGVGVVRDGCDCELCVGEEGEAVGSGLVGEACHGCGCGALDDGPDVFPCG